MLTSLSFRSITPDAAHEEFGLNLDSNGYILEVEAGAIVAAENLETSDWTLFALLGDDMADATRIRHAKSEEHAVRLLRTIGASFLTSDFKDGGAIGTFLRDHYDFCLI